VFIMSLHVIGPETGRLLVLSPALGASSAMWEPQIPGLSKRFRVVLYDHPPLDSVAALASALAEELDEHGFEHYSFCGLSLGAMVGMQLAADRPDYIDRLVLACTAARFGEPADWAHKAELVRREGMHAVAHDALDKWLTPRYERRGPYLWMQLSTRRETYARGLEAIAGFDFRDRLGEIAAPTLVIAGSEDEATTVEDAELIKSGIPRSRLTVLKGAAHLANVEQAEEFTRAVTHHLAA
jgi:3-oxoadipate enol-lactonase